MKKPIVYLLSLLTAGFFLTGCGDKKTEEIEFTNLTVEQNKVKIQDEGLAAVDKLNGMSNLSGIFALQDFETLMYNSTMTGDPIALSVGRFIAPIARMDKDVMGVTQLRSTALSIDTLSTIMEQIGGVYTYNRMTNAFNRVANATKIEFIFPIGSSTTNNGKLTIGNLTSQVASSSDYELPKSLDMTLSKGTSALLSFNFTASYDTKDTPTAWSTALTFSEGYKFTQSMTNTTTDVSWQFAYTYNTDNLLSGKFSSKGNFSQDVMNDTEDLSDTEMIDKVLDNANSYVQLGNLKLTGLANVNGMMDAYDKAFPTVDAANTQADVTKVCQMLNSNVTLVLMYAKEGTAIAKSNFYSSEYSDYKYNGMTHQWYEVTYYQPSMQLLFKDGSAMDESFFAQGFENLQGAFMDMMTALQMSYSN